MLLAAGFIVLAAITLASDIGIALPRSPEQQAVARAVEQALTARVTAAVPEVRDSAGNVPASELERLHDALRTTADQLFAGGYHDAWIATMDAVIGAEGSGNSRFSGGADTFSRWRIDVQDNQATVHVRARIFMEEAQTPLGDRSIAEGFVDFDIRLRYVDGSWHIGLIDERYAPRSGP